VPKASAEGGESIEGRRPELIEFIELFESEDSSESERPVEGFSAFSFEQ